MRLGAHIGDASSSLRQVYTICQILFPSEYTEKELRLITLVVSWGKSSANPEWENYFKKKKIGGGKTQLNLYLKVRVGMLFRTQNSKR